MREIKFRAWDGESMKYDGNERIFDFHEYMNSPIMQYTGLKDRNSKEIYEGDIITAWYEFPRTAGQGEFRTSEVVYSEDAEWVLPNLDYLISDYFFEGVSDEIEVIGNKYEDPELL